MTSNRVMAVALFAAAAGSCSLADEIRPALPALYDVEGLASDDRLNIRAKPSADAPIVGDLGPDDVGVEVLDLSLGGAWALINFGEDSGFVAMRFLEPSEAVRDAHGLPDGLRCFGTEPFWSATFSQVGLEYRGHADGQTRQSYEITWTSPAPQVLDLGRTGALITWQMSELGETSNARILPGRCSDGMSDRIYGLHFIDPRIGYGCCSLAR